MHRLRLSAIPVLLATAAVALAGCSGSGGTTTATAPAAAPSATPAGRGGPNRGPGGMQRVPGTSGTVASVETDRIEVQNPSFGQVTVTFSASTRFSQTVEASVSDIAAGDCVQAVAAGQRPAGAGGAGSDAGGSGSRSGTGGAPAPTDGPFTATVVTIVGKADASGACAANGAFGRGGARPTAGPRTRTPRPRPTGTARPGGAGGNGQFGGFGGLVAGRVVSVSGTSFVVAREARGGAAPGNQTVRTTGTTTVTRTESATAKALAVGTCATALGKADDTGTVAATTISLRKAGPQGCVQAGGFRRGMGGGNG
ncbi:DUF5666 domain-containing protein [Actinopolymorpha pittospori]